MKRSILTKSMAFAMLLVLLTIPVFAQNTSSGNIKLIGAWPLEAKMEAGYTLKIPMLEGDGALFSGNNLKVKGLLGLSPVAATLGVDAVLTPIAVLELTLGGALGSGWDFDAMEISGLLKGPGAVDSGITLIADPLGGVYYKARAGAAFQFDTGAIFPGDWTSILLRTYHEFMYQGYTGAKADEAWEYENSGSKVNGFNYKGEYVIGYKLPIKLNMVALQLETFSYNLFGDVDHPFRYDVGAIGNAEFFDGLNLTMIVQWTNQEKDKNTKEVKVVDFRYKRIGVMLNYSF
ncbi:MAG: hypothetical protein EOM68_05820 [Spirochaetia bacterium]|nr:hypothetical protein [Spirochaetia bacterium]